MEGTVKERLKQFIKHLGISEREFCRRVGVGSAYIQSIRKSIMPDTLQQITIQFPQLNPLWLMMGEGEMLLPEEKPEEKAPEAAPSEILLKLLDDAQNEKARLLSIIESQQRTIERQQMTIESLTELTKKVDVRRGDNATCAAVG
ncbi:MAG: helix-turn-helix transcriptional regulator [Bacteroidales bacterium]|nr:helix-turn-helix transcriptional regulator [Bacteroidales bacterium]